MAHTSREILLAKLETANTFVSKGEIWQHTESGGRYLIEGVAVDEGTEEVRIEYRELDHDPAITWLRSLDGEKGWITPTEINGMPAPRFTKIQ